ncbi:MAG: hypothetical protein OJF50_002624 [Nitrospira sp.]|nr:hypothetical protein [Nitrospira sp.]
MNIGKPSYYEKRPIQEPTPKKTPLKEPPAPKTPPIKEPPRREDPTPIGDSPNKRRPERVSTPPLS